MDKIMDIMSDEYTIMIIIDCAFVLCCVASHRVKFTLTFFFRKLLGVSN